MAISKLSLRSARPDQTWKLKTEDGSEFGPVPLADLELWARQGRVGPNHRIAADGEDWFPACDLRDLGMEWMLDTGGGESVGPFNLQALGELVQEGTVALTARLSNRITGESTTVEQQQEHILAGLPTPEAFAQLEQARQELADEKARAERQLVETQQRAAALEAELAGSAGALAEARQAFERRLSENERTLGDGAAEAERLRLRLQELEDQKRDISGQLDAAQIEVRRLKDEARSPSPGTPSAPSPSLELQARLEQIEQAVILARSQMADQSSSIETALAARHERERELLARIDALQGQFAESQTALDAAREELAAERARQLQVQAEGTDSTGQLEALSAEGRSALSRLEQAGIELQEQRKAHDAAVAKAQESEEIQRRLRVDFEAQSSDLRSQLDRVRNELAEERARADGTAREHGQRESALLAKIEGLDAARGELASRVAELQRDAESKQAALADAEQAIHALRAQEETLRQELQSDRERRDEHARELESRAQVTAEQLAELRTAREAEAAEADAARREGEARLAAIGAELERARKEAGEQGRMFEDQIKKLNSIRAEAGKEIETLRRGLQEREAERGAARERAGQLENELDSTRASAKHQEQELRAGLDRLAGEQDEVRRALDEARRALAGEQSAHAGTRRESEERIRALESGLAELRTAREAEAAEADAARREGEARLAAIGAELERARAEARRRQQTLQVELQALGALHASAEEGGLTRRIEQLQQDWRTLSTKADPKERESAVRRMVTPLAAAPSHEVPAEPCHPAAAEHGDPEPIPSAKPSARPRRAIEPVVIPPRSGPKLTEIEAQAQMELKAWKTNRDAGAGASAGADPPKEKSDPKGGRKKFSPVPWLKLK